MNFSDSRKPSFRLKSEWKKILTSLILAFIFWFSLSRLNYIEKKVVLPISYKNLPTNFIVVEGMESNVSLIIRAKEEFLKTSNLSNLIKPVVYLDIARPGVSSYPIDIILNTPVQDISVKLLKNEVKLSVDEISAAELEVKPHLTGIPGRGYFIEDLKIDLKKIRVYGPKTIILTQSFLTTEPLSVEGITNSLFTNLYIILPEHISSDENTNLNIEIIIKPLTPESNVISYFPIQKLENILSRIASSLDLPVISSIQLLTFLKSLAINSSDNPS